MTTYLCGGINGLADADCIRWRERAKSLLRTETLDPMSRDYRGNEDGRAADIVRGDLEDIAKGDFVLVNATKPSWGTAMEIVYARQAGKRIFAFTATRVSPWLLYHCDGICLDLDSACATINASISPFKVLG